MSLYSIEDTTLTAIGDAIRSKTSKYISVDEMPTPTFEVSFDTREMEEYVIKNDVRRYTIPFNLIEMFGDKRAKITKLYVSGNYECYVGSGFTYWPGELIIGFDINKHQIAGGSNYLLNGEINSTIEIPARYWDVENTFIQLSGNDWCFTDKPIYDAWYKANIKIWAIASDGSYFTYNSFTPLEMADAITGLMTIPDEAFNITGDCQYRFAFNGSNWLINNYEDKITTKDISNANYMFYYSDVLKEIPFEINMKKDGSIEYMFNNCHQLLHSPKVNYPELTKHIKFGSVFANCYRLREVPEWFVDLLERDYNLPVKNTTFGPWTSLFNYCCAIRKIPDRVMKSIRNDNMTGNYYGVCYSKPFSGMSCLDELVGVHCDNYNYTRNEFSNFFNNLDRVKDITFATNDDGTPVVRPWKSQTIDLTKYIGSCSNGTYDILNYTTITLDTRVIDDTTYQALKNDPDYWTTDVNYSRYNHDSAVNTINSLPDCSATGTNTIKFKGQSGAKTDGGAINTLTEEEIAVATVKGWTITFA